MSIVIIVLWIFISYLSYLNTRRYLISEEYLDNSCFMFLIFDLLPISNIVSLIVIFIVNIMEGNFKKTKCYNNSDFKDYNLIEKIYQTNIYKLK